MTKVYWPQWHKNAAGEGRIFNSPEEVEPGWMTVTQFRALDRDGKGGIGGSEPVAADDERSRLVAALEAAGKPHDKRWGVKKLQAALDAG